MEGMPGFKLVCLWVSKSQKPGPAVRKGLRNRHTDGELPTEYLPIKISSR
jgi:hypothetical protein